MLSSSAFSSGLGGNAQHTGVSAVAGQPLEQIVFQTPVNLNPQPGGNVPLHFGEPAVTAANTLIVPVQTGASGGFEIEAVDGYNGSVRWIVPTDYVLPPSESGSFTTSFGPVLTPQGRVYFAGAGGTIDYFDNPDSLTAPVVHQLAFYGLANYQANPAAFNSTVSIDTPLTSDANGDIFFGFRVQGHAPAPIQSSESGYARIDANGSGTFVLVGDMTGHPGIRLDAANAAPAVSNDGTTLYVVAKSPEEAQSYLVALNSTTLATKSEVFLVDPRTGQAATISDQSSAAPVVGPDGSVFYALPGSSSGDPSGLLLHFSGDLSQEFAPGAFGGDQSPSIVPASMVPGYTGTSSYLIFTKYSNAATSGSPAATEIAILDPNATQPDSGSSILVMKQVVAIAAPSPGSGAVGQWSINTAAVVPGDDSIYATTQDGTLYRWDLATDTLAEGVKISSGNGAAETPTWMGPDGKIYAISAANLFAVGAVSGNFGANPQHSGIFNNASQTMDSIHWQTTIDQDFAAGIPAHYGQPVFTPHNTVIVPVKTGLFGNFELVAFNGATGQQLWTVTTNYQLPPSGFLPAFQPVYSAVDDRVYFADNGGTIDYINHPDSPNATLSGQVAFYGTAAYNANPAAFNSSVVIDTPLTVDNNGTVFFGFMVLGPNPAGLTGGGVGRVATTGAGTFVLANAAVGGNDPIISRVAVSAAPALSLDDSIVYVAVNGADFDGEPDVYLLGLDSKTLATVHETGPVLDPRSTPGNVIPDSDIDESSASPVVAPDGSVFFGTFGNVFNFNGSRGFLLHFSANLQQEFTPGAFGWDDSISIVPASMVPSYTGTSSFLIFSKYNNYAAAFVGPPGGNGINEVAILDPYATEPDPNNDTLAENGAPDDGLLVMKQVQVIESPTPDFLGNLFGFPDAVTEWCINATAVDPFTDSVFVNNADGFAYRWNLATNTFTQAVQITPGFGEPYTPTAIGPDGTIYVINGGTLFALGATPNYSLSETTSENTAQFGDSLTFTATIKTPTGSPAPTGSITFLDEGNALATVPLSSSGVASFTSAPLPVGHFHITAEYSGDANFAPGQTTLVQPVLDQTTTSVFAFPNPAIAGEGMELEATISPVAFTSLTPAGTVTFMDGNTVLATTSPSAFGGPAFFFTSSLSPGTHTITAVFNGDVNFVGSTSQTLQLVVRQLASVTTVASSASSSTFGQAVTFTATVAANPALQFAPTGTVTFLDGTTVLGTGTLTNGTATFQTSSLSVGTHSITASYGGSATFMPSTSAAITQTVSPAAPAVASANVAAATVSSPVSTDLAATIASGLDASGSDASNNHAISGNATVIDQLFAALDHKADQGNKSSVT